MRYSRQDLKHDKFADTAANALHWTVEHRQKMVNAAIAAALVLVLVVGGLWYMNNRNQQASVELGKALATFNAPLRGEGAPPDPNIRSFVDEKERAAASKTEFAVIADKYGSTQSGQMAKYFVALSDEDLGDMQGAEAGLKSLTDVRNGDVAGLAKFALASLYRDTNRDNDAVGVYKSLIDHPAATVPKTTAQLELASMYEAKQPAEAKKIYEQIVKDEKGTAAAELAQQRQAGLKVQ